MLFHPTRNSKIPPPPAPAFGHPPVGPAAPEAYDAEAELHETSCGGGCT